MLSEECARLLAGAPPRPERRALTLDQNRDSLEAMAKRFGPVHPGVAVADSTCAGVPIRTYRPMGWQEPGGTCLYAHGGGWVLGSLETHHAICSHLAAASGCQVVSIGYRRPPEAPFPAALDDVLAVARWMASGNVAGIDPGRLAIAGDSAGGNLAAASCLALQDEVAFELAVLLLPVLDNRPDMYDSYREFATGFSLTADDMDWYFEHYVGAGWRDQRDPLLVPAQAVDLASFPPTLVVTAECDVLRDEGEAFAGRLAAAGRPVLLERVTGTFHPFVLFLAELEAARQTVAMAAEAVRKSLVRPI